MDNQTAVVKFPPEYDGELYIHLSTTDETLVKIELNLYKIEGESYEDTLRRFGEYLVSNPIGFTKKLL